MVSPVMDEDAKVEWMRQVGKRVRLARLAAELTQEQAGQASGTSRSFISLVEHGSDVSLTRFWRIADALGVSPVYLLTGEQPR